MSYATTNLATQFEVAQAWTTITDGPLHGLALAREAGLIFAWDDADHLYLFDSKGERLILGRAPGQIKLGAVSDDGSLFVLLGEGSRLWLLDRNLEVSSERDTLSEPQALAVDPHGQYLAVAAKLGTTQLYNRYGRLAGRFETLQALAHMAFVPSRPLIIGAAAHGSLFGIELEADGSGGLDAEVAWRQSVLSNVGRLTLSGDGGMVLASCFTHGIQRYDQDGQNEGSYHLGGTVVHAVPDFAGRLIGVATLEGELAVINRGGNLRWKTQLARPAIALEMDALGRYLIVGQGTGELTRMDLEVDSARPKSEPKPRTPGTEPAKEPSRPAAVASGVRAPAWSLPIARSDDQAEGAVVAVLDDPPRIGAITNTGKLQVFTAEGEALGQTSGISGVGRIVRTAPGWLAAATDRQILLYDARRNQPQPLDLILAELTHLVLRPDTYGVFLVQEGDRLSRGTTAGRWVWKRELDSSVEDAALGPENLAAVTTQDGRLRLFDVAGQPSSEYVSRNPEPLCMIEATEGAPGEVAWITLARRFQVLRGHQRDGRVLWEAPIPWEAWQLHRVGRSALVVAPDGRAIAFDANGRLIAQSRGIAPSSVFGPGPDGEPLCIFRQGVHLICSDLSGKVRWRTLADPPRGPLAAGRSGVAAVIGRQLAWFPSS